MAQFLDIFCEIRHSINKNRNNLEIPIINFGNSVGKFGVLADEFMEWLGTKDGKSALRTAVGGAMKSLLDAREVSKREAAKLFVPVGELNFPGFTEEWRAGEFFAVANRETKFCHVDSRLLNFLGGGKIGGSPARKLVVQRPKC